MSHFSIVIPVFNEETNVSVLVERVSSTMRVINEPFDIILVDDGSSDDTWNRILTLKQDYPELTGLRLSRNFGHQGALIAGLSHAKGDAVISMDGDLQHPPEVLPKLVEKWRSGAKVVLTRRKVDESASSFKKATSKYFYQVFSTIAETEIEAGTSDFRLLDKQVLHKLLSLNFGQPFLRGAVQTLGFPRATVEFDVAKRFSGQSKYTLKKMLRFAKHGLISHSSVPLRFGIWLGIFTSMISVLELIYVINRFLAGETVPGWASTLGITSLFAGVLFFLLGIIGLYLEDIHRLLKAVPHYIISETTSHNDQKEID